VLRSFGDWPACAPTLLRWSAEVLLKRVFLRNRRQLTLESTLSFAVSRCCRVKSKVAWTLPRFTSMCVPVCPLLPLFGHWT
jgi:hypothetical protein